MAELSFEEKKRIHEEEVKNNVEAAKDSSHYCTYYLPTGDVFDSDLSVYAARRRGRSHVQGHKPCQDFCAVDRTDHCQILTVSDGVSACERSDSGSRFACESVIEAVKELDRAFEHDFDSRETDFANALCDVAFRKNVINRWLAKIGADVKERDNIEPISLEHINLYGATLSFAVVTDSYIVTGNLGDGQILLFGPVDAVRVRWHPPKEDSVTSALCNPDCYEDAFIMNKHRREVYSGVLLSTDGIYDTLSTYQGFYAYAKQITKRFEQFERLREPTRPFCYLDQSVTPERWIDLSANITQDDCSIVLAVDHRPISSLPSVITGALSKKYTVSELRGRTETVSVYTVTKDGKSYIAVASHEDGQAKNAERQTVQLPEFQKARIVEKCEEIECDGARISVYEDIPYHTPANYFAAGKLKEKNEKKYGINASGMAFRTYYMLNSFEKELKEKGLCLNDDAHLLSFFTNDGLVVLPEAISADREGCAPAYLWSLYTNMLGILLCDGKFARPIFSTGFYHTGSFLMNPYKKGPEPLCHLRRMANNEYALQNDGKSDWLTEDGRIIHPTETLELTDGMSFRVAESGGEQSVTVSYVSI